METMSTPDHDATNHSPSHLPMRASATINALVVALAKAQGAFPDIGKDKTARIQTKSGTAYVYSYADLGTILAAVRKPLSENELAVLQPVHVNGTAVTVTTILAHGSGQWVSDALDMPIGDPSDARSLASAVTYARRYGLIALLGIAPADEDDDAGAATTRAAIPSSRPPRSGVLPKTTTRPGETAAPPATEMISEAQRKRLFAIAKEHGWSTAALKLWLGARAITSTHDIPHAQYDALIDALALERPPAPAADRTPGEEG